MSKIDFNKTYKREDFLNFFQNEFLPEDFQISEEEVDLNFQAKYIKNVTKLGECPDLRLKVYEITHESDKDPRVSLTKEAFRLMKVYNDFYVIAIFKSRNPDNFRLSYVTIGIKPEDKKIEYEYSNPRRYSFFLGHDAQVHTPEEYLIKKGRIKNFDDLQERFSIEVVNKEFYRKIAHLFTKLVGGKRKEGSKTNEYEAILKLPSCNDHKKMQEFAVRLIGRIMFCWFLKKKTTPNGETLIPEQTLSFGATKKHSNYYHSILENLFFQVLNTPQSKRKEKFNINYFENIPFLNGGLFEPQDDDFYDIDESTGHSKYINVLKIPDSWFEELLYLLETYNFTIDESTPIDIELSIDPEMLGRIFENLLAEINPETGETVRKSTGSYYTPRPIVEYMVDESLKQYLITKTEIKEQKLQKLLSYYSEEEDDLSDKEKDQIIDALDKVKIIDPACGSSAFPIGVLQKMVLILQKVDPDSMNWLIKQLDRIPDTYVRKMVEDQLMKEDWDYIRKLGIIQNSIYGVDIQEIAVEISKLRVFLSLIVDAKVDENEDNLGIKPLPNLEFKFVCANSLIGLPERTASMFEAKDQIKELKSLRDRYFSSYGDEKHRIEKKFKVTQNQMSKYMYDMNLEKGKTMDEQTFALSDWNPFSYKQSDWFDPEWMFGIKQGFDIVIANPPYGNILTNEIKRKVDKLYSYSSSSEISSPFIEKSVNLLRDYGNLVFIITFAITFNKKMSRNRNTINNTFKESFIYTFDRDRCRIFEAMSQSVSIMKCFKKNSDEKFGIYTSKFFRETPNINNIPVNKANGFLLPRGSSFNSSHRLPKFGDDLNVNIIKKLLFNNENIGDHLGNTDSYIWIRTSGNYWYNAFSRKPYNSSEIKKKNVSNNIKGFLLLLVNSSLFYFWLRIYGDGRHLNIDILEEFPCNKNKIIKMKGVFNVFAKRFMKYLFEVFDAERERFISSKIKNKIDCLDYILGKYVFDLNIHEMIYIMNYDSKIRGGVKLIRKELVEKILSITKDEDYLENKQKKDKVKALEAEIDQLVYKLYDLTPEEIKVVEGKTMDKSQKQISDNLDDDSKMESNKKEEIICPNCGAPMVFKKGDLSDFYHCQKCKKTIVDSMIDEVIKKDK